MGPHAGPTFEGAAFDPFVVSAVLGCHRFSSTILISQRYYSRHDTLFSKRFLRLRENRTDK